MSDDVTEMTAGYSQLIDRIDERDAKLADLQARLDAAEGLLRECRNQVDQTFRITGNLKWAGQLKDLSSRIDTFLTTHTQGDAS